MDGLSEEIRQGLSAGNQAQASRLEADRRIDDAIRSKRLVVDGAPDGYIWCVDHQTVPGVDPITGEWLRGGGTCIVCLQEKKEGKGRYAGAPADAAVGAQGAQVDRAPASPDTSFVDGGRQKPHAIADDVARVRYPAGMVAGRPESVLQRAPAPRSDDGASGADPWDDVFGFPQGELRRGGAPA